MDGNVTMKCLLLHMNGYSAAVTLLVVGVGAGAAMRAETQTGIGRLQLEEVGALAVPDSFALKGIAAGPRGSLVLWSANQDYLLLYRQGKQVTIGSGYLRRPIAAGFSDDEAVVEVLDADRMSRVRLSGSGDVLSEAPLLLPMRPESAVSTRNSWFVGGRDDEGKYLVFQLSPDMQAKEIHRLVSESARDASSLAAHLT